MAEPITVLIADDEHLVRKGIRFLLSQQPDFRVVAEATNGLEAVELTGQHCPQIILMDIRMPGLDGLAALEKIRSLDPSVKTVILSGYSDFAYAQKALKLGASDYMLKPTDLPELLKVLTRLKEVIYQEEEEKLEKVKRQTQLSYGICAFMEQFYWQLLGDEFLPGELAEKMRILEIKEKEAAVLLVGMDNCYQLKIANSKEQYLELCSKIKLLLQDFLGNELVQKPPVLQTEEGYFIIIYFLSNLTEVLQFAIKLKDWLKEKTGESFSVAIGPEQSLISLSVSYHSAVSRLKQRLILGRDIVIADDLNNQDMEVRYPVEMEKELARAVRFGDQAQARKCLDYIFDRVASTGKFNPDSWWQLCFDLLEMGYKIAQELHITQSVSMLEKGKEISILTTEADIRIWISNFLDEIIQKIKDTDFQPSLAVRKAFSYIDEHFAEELSLTSVASHIGLSPNYLSQVFKQSTGKTFLEHLIGRRVEEAKKLLKQGDLNVSEISFRIGYDNPRYFSQVFHKQEGVTPSEYRKSIR
jgi:two-component system response regulator YesN